MDVLFNHHDDIQGISLFETSIKGDAEYAFLFTNESPGGRVVTFGLHTDEAYKPYKIDLWDMDDDGNLFRKPDEEEEDEKWWNENSEEPEDPDRLSMYDEGSDETADLKDIGKLRTMMRSLST